MMNIIVALNLILSTILIILVIFGGSNGNDASRKGLR